MSEMLTGAEVGVTGERYHAYMSTPVPMIDGSFEPADLLAKRLHEGAYGQVMRNEQPLRFTQRYEFGTREQMLDSYGLDLCPIGHQVELGYHGSMLLEQEFLHNANFPLSAEDQAAYILACQIHDMGETIHSNVKAVIGTVIGDIAAGMKTDEDRITETEIRWFLYDTELADVAPHIIDKVEAIISHSDTSVLHELFEAAHEAQTLETVIRAREVSDTIGWQNGTDALRLSDNSSGIASSSYAMSRLVLETQLARCELFKKYRYVQELMEKAPYSERLAA